MKQIGSEDARRKFRDLLDDAQRGERTEISRNGKPIAVVVPADWYSVVIDYVHATTFSSEATRFYGQNAAYRTMIDGAALKASTRRSAAETGETS